MLNPSGTFGTDRRNKRRLPRLAFLAFSMLVLGTASVLSCSTAGPSLTKKFSEIVWVAYSPTRADPNKQLEPTLDDIRADLSVLHQAGFTGLVTYSASGVMGRALPQLAVDEGFTGLIVGVWEPANEEELANAASAALNPIVLGICVGNEGLGKRYKMPELSAAIDGLRKTTGKPVTTTEEVDDYADDTLLRLGDWVFPNVHPYFHNQLAPEAAVGWTKAAYDDLLRRSGRLVLLKEVGLPTAGDAAGQVSEANQESYYLQLAQTDARFVYFEGFDQPWKTHLPIEPHWGLFKVDRTPKLLAKKLLQGKSVAQPTVESSFYVYEDVDSPNNHYQPTGYMGDIGDIHVNEAFRENPHSGTTSIRVIYDAKGTGPNECAYRGPCNWAGVYWQEPANNWGKEAALQGRGFDLSGNDRLVFSARADRACTIEFKVGGINETYGDTLLYPRTKLVDLKTDWQVFEIDLSGTNLKHIIGGFAWVCNRQQNSAGATFYLDDIRFIKS